MNRVRDYYGVCFAGGTVTLLARVEDAEGVALAPGEIGSASYRVDARDACSAAPVEGHDGVPLTPGDVLYGSLQTGAPWDADATGYNFRHEVDVTQHAAFPTAGKTYAVTYELTPTGGQPVLFRFLIEAL